MSHPYMTLMRVCFVGAFLSRQSGEAQLVGQVGLVIRFGMAVPSRDSSAQDTLRPTAKHNPPLAGHRMTHIFKNSGPYAEEGMHP